MHTYFCLYCIILCCWIKHSTWHCRVAIQFEYCLPIIGLCIDIYEYGMLSGVWLLSRRIHVLNNSPGSSVSSPTSTFRAFSIIGDTICITRGNTSDFGVVTRKWNTKVDIIFLKKGGNTLSIWKLPGEKNYEDSVHIHSIFYSLGNNGMSVSSNIMKDIKSKLNTSF